MWVNGLFSSEYGGPSVVFSDMIDATVRQRDADN